MSYSISISICFDVDIRANADGVSLGLMLTEEMPWRCLISCSQEQVWLQLERLQRSFGSFLEGAHGSVPPNAIGRWPLRFRVKFRIQ